jgi:hypothetical protein
LAVVVAAVVVVVVMVNRAKAAEISLMEVYAFADFPILVQNLAPRGAVADPKHALFR